MLYMKNISLQQPRMMDQVQFLIATTLQVDLLISVLFWKPNLFRNKFASVC